MCLDIGHGAVTVAVAARGRVAARAAAGRENATGTTKTVTGVIGVHAAGRENATGTTKTGVGGSGGVDHGRGRGRLT